MTVKLSYQQGANEPPLLNDTIGAAFDRTVEQYPEHMALIVRHQNIRWSYKEYQTEVNKLATGLLALGVKPGDRIGIWSPNNVQWCLSQFASAKIGAVMVCINPAYRLYELEYVLNKVQCKVLISDTEFKSSHYLAMLNELAPEISLHNKSQLLCSTKLPYLKTIVQMGECQVNGMHRFADVLKLGSSEHYVQLNVIAESLQADDAINIQFTSGTTGSPKGATLSHRNILNNGKIVGDGMLLTEYDKLCIPVPLYHCFGMVMGNLACITHGSTAVFPSASFDPISALQTVSEERCTALHGVPTMFIAQLEHPEFSQFDLSSLRTGIMAGSPCPIEVMKKVMKTMHMEQVLIAYGQTELSPVNHMTTVDDPIEKRVTSVGRPTAHLEIQLIDENNQQVPVGQAGEICVRGYSVMKGYWEDEMRTAQTIDTDGWLHSGDIGVMDEDGFVEIVGRMKDMIIRGGENVYPREVEEFLYKHPAIQDVQVFGIPNNKYGEEVCAWIKLTPNANLDKQGVLDFCKNQITYFKVPSNISFVEEFPMTVTGKIQKFKMRDIAIGKKHYVIKGKAND